MHAAKVATVVIGIVLLGSLPSSAASAAAPEDSAGSESPLTPGGIESARQFRMEFGLAADPHSISLAASDPSFSIRYGVPLSQSELSDLDARASEADRITSAMEPYSGDPSYGGIYFEQSRGGLAHVLVGENAAGLDAKIREAAAGMAVEVDRVLFGLTRLRAVRASVEANLDRLATDFGVNRVSIDERLNRVLLGVDPYTESIANSLMASIGPEIAVEAADPPSMTGCTSRDDCNDPSMKGGLRIYYSAGGGNYPACTSGFMARKTTTPLADEWFVLTAGHCTSSPYGGSGGTPNWYHNLTPLGHVWNSYLSNNAWADAGVIKLPFDVPTNSTFQSSTSDIKLVTGRQANSNQALGVGVCRAGAKSNNFLCGTITLRDATVTGIETPNHLFITLVHMWEMSRPSQPGDSGGSMVWNNTAFGVESYVTTGGHSGYSTIDNISTKLGMRPCYSNLNNPCQ